MAAVRARKVRGPVGKGHARAHKVVEDGEDAPRVLLVRLLRGAGAALHSARGPRGLAHGLHRAALESLQEGGGKHQGQQEGNEE